MKEGRALAAHVKGVEELAQGEGGEGHGVGGGVGLAGVGEHILPQEIGRQGQQPHHHPLPGQPEGKAVGKEGGVGVPGRLGHDPLLHRLHPQGQGGQGVGDQVEPQKLHRHQRHLVEVEHRGAEDGENFSDVAGEQVVDGLLDVGVDAPALLHGGDDGGEVVVGEDHIGGSLGHVGAGNPHGAADVRHLEGGGVVDAVAGHGHHLSPGLPRLDDTHLVLGGHPGIDGELLHLLLQHLLGQKVQILPRQGQVPGTVDV